jgi:hypothetical protein
MPGKCRKKTGKREEKGGGQRGKEPKWEM